MSPEADAQGTGGPAEGGAAGPADPPLSVELRALYEQLERATSMAERQAIWNAIVAHQRSREVRVGTDAAQAREAVVGRHKRRRLWPF